MSCRIYSLKGCKSNRAFCATIGSDTINVRILDAMIDLARSYSYVW
ncbi:hypothetical protein [Edwardsiella ictaluri]